MREDYQHLTEDRALTERLNVSFALKAANLGVWELDPTTNVVNWDQRCRELFGLSATSSLSYQQAICHVHPDDVTRVDAAVQRAMTAQVGGSYDVTYRTIGAGDGRLRWVRFVGQAYFDPSGDVREFAGIAQDVTEDRLNQQATNSAEQFRVMVEQAPVAMAHFSGPEFVITLANERVLEYWGRQREQVINKPLFSALPEASGQGFEELLMGVYTTGNRFVAKELPVNLERNGQVERTYINFVYEPFRRSDGTITGVTVACLEVTDQVLSRRKIEETEASLRGAMDLAELGAWELNAVTNQVTYSDRIKYWFGFAGNEISERVVYGPIHEEDRSRVEAAIRNALRPGSSGLYQEEYRVVEQQTGYQRIVHAQGKTFFDEQGDPVKLSGTAQDITQYRLLQHDLEQQVELRTQQLQASVRDLKRSNQNLQQFAYVASHDLQEPLRKIQSFGDILRSQYADQLGEGVDHLQRMQTAASRMSVLIRDLLTYSRITTQQEATASVSLSAVVGAVLSNLEVVIGETGAQVSVETLPTVQGDDSQLGQLFQNLLSNALKFRRSGVSPAIRIRAQRVAAANLPAAVRPTQVAEGYHCIEVADNGIGFDDKYVERIFQVFQRLHGRSAFAGTGIGLAICEKVAANHGGGITAMSKPGQGATFSVYLPVLV